MMEGETIMIEYIEGSSHVVADVMTGQEVNTTTSRLDGCACVSMLV